MAGLRHIPRPAFIPFSWLFGLVVLIRNWLFDRQILKSVRFKIPVISVGNITVGGTGKTPHVEYLLQLLRDDLKLAVLSRGYKRKTRHFILASKKHSVSDVGDEPMQIKLKFPEVHVAVDRSRVKGIETLIKRIRKLDAIILDDAFQHRYVKPGLSILLTDYNRPVFNDFLMPAGNLREPCKNLKRADIIIVTKCPAHLSPQQRAGFTARLNPSPNQEVYFTKYTYGSPLPVFPDKHGKPKEIPYKQLHKSGTRVMLVTGIANPGPFKRFIQEIVPVSEEIAFPDHHNYNRQDLLRIKSRFKNLAAREKYIMVTEKDAVRIRESFIADTNFRKVFYYIPVEVKFMAKGEKPFIKRMNKFIKKSRIEN